ncbi:hypothetical protein AB0M72_13935 [Nocardiopsis dassonvillei]|uniref:hypothetical protein n=1 Tax=Nocardiopsis dassonvillei TaxID=2014 RepID=UPI00200D71F6|nr:hypothetical protein [Nocardiopsis dassonvillei]MCK9869441.1 hypothetical protein [Nocardiopsis dassonvillei]
MSSDHERPPPLPRPVTGVFVRHIMQTACPGYFAMVWVDAEPLPEEAAGDFAFVDDLPPTCRYTGEPLPREFVEAFEEAAREAWREREEGLPAFAARMVLRDAVWHWTDSNAWSFQVAGRLAAREILSCAAEGREPRAVGRSARRDRPIPPMPRTLPSSGTAPSA